MNEAALIIEERQLDPATVGDHIDRLFRAAWALCGRREDAEDMVQETYARVLARPRFLRREDDLGYLLRVLRNTYLNHRRTLERRPKTAVMVDEFEFAADSCDPWRALEAREVFAAVSALPETYREVLVAVDVLGLGYVEAARALGIKPGTVPSRLARARARVADSLGGETAV